jgi:hypothetical protein
LTALPLECTNKGGKKVNIENVPSSYEVGPDNHKEIIEMVIPSFLDKIDYHKLPYSPTRLIPKVYSWIIIKAEKKSIEEKAVNLERY